MSTDWDRNEVMNIFTSAGERTLMVLDSFYHIFKLFDVVLDVLNTMHIISRDPHTCIL